MRQVLAFAFALMWPPLSAVATAEATEPRWYRGTTHVHGVVEGYGEDVAPDWYRRHGYDFIVRTEHERIIGSDRDDDGRDGFLVISGQEITQLVQDATHADGFRHAHVNGLGLRTEIKPLVAREPDWSLVRGLKSDGERVAAALKVQATSATRMSMAQSYQRNIEEVRAQGGVPQVNHPNFHWSVRPGDLELVDGPFLLEIANGYPFANNAGGVSTTGEAAPSTEAFWDRLLSEGKTVWAVASDDSHDYENFDEKYALTPGKGWIFVRAPALDRDAILASLRAGDFYASTGVELSDIQADERSLTVRIRQLPVRFKRDGPVALPSSSRFSTSFIGKDGRVLKRASGESARYVFRGDETYVRARIKDSDGRYAWTQPVFLGRRKAGASR